MACSVENAVDAGGGSGASSADKYNTNRRSGFFGRTGRYCSAAQLLSGAVAGAIRMKEQTMPTAIPSMVGFAKAPWNKGRLIGQKRPLKPKEVWAIRVRLQLEHCRRDLALFDLAVDQQAARLRPRAAPGEGRMCRGSDR